MTQERMLEGVTVRARGVCQPAFPEDTRKVKLQRLGREWPVSLSYFVTRLPAIYSAQVAPRTRRWSPSLFPARFPFHLPSRLVDSGMMSSEEVLRPSRKLMTRTIFVSPGACVMVSFFSPSRKVMHSSNGASPRYRRYGNRLNSLLMLVRRKSQ